MIYNKVIFTDLKEKTQLDAPGNFVATGGSGKISLVWTDPEDVQDEDGDPLATWSKTRIVRKEGSPPRNANDGVPILESTEKNQYSNTPYEDTSVSDEVTYYYGAFARSAEGTWSDGAFSSSETLLGTPLSELAEGTIIKINENGAPVEFYLAKHNYEPDLNGQGRELVVRKDVYGKTYWYQQYPPTSTYVDYFESALSRYLTTSYLNLFSETLRNYIGQTTIEITDSSYREIQTTSLSVFVLSLQEYGLTQDQYLAEGSTLPIASTLRGATLDGEATEKWTRTRYRNGQTYNYTTSSTRTAPAPCTAGWMPAPSRRAPAARWSECTPSRWGTACGRSPSESWATGAAGRRFLSSTG